MLAGIWLGQYGRATKVPGRIADKKLNVDKRALDRSGYACGANAELPSALELRYFEEPQVFDPESIITILVCAGVAGWLAALAVEGYGLGLVGNVLVGAIGSAGAALAAAAVDIHLEEGAVGIAAATGGAMLVLLVVSLMRRL